MLSFMLLQLAWFRWLNAEESHTQARTQKEEVEEEEREREFSHRQRFVHMKNMTI